MGRGALSERHLQASEIVVRKKARTLHLLGNLPHRPCTQESGIERSKVPITPRYYYFLWKSPGDIPVYIPMKRRLSSLSPAKHWQPDVYKCVCIFILSFPSHSNYRNSWNANPTHEGESNLPERAVIIWETFLTRDYTIDLSCAAYIRFKKLCTNSCTSYVIGGISLHTLLTHIQIHSQT